MKLPTSVKATRAIARLVGELIRALAAIASAVPGGLRMAMAMLRAPALRRLPMTFGWMTKRPIEAAVFDGWLDAYAADRRVRRDVGEMMKAVDRQQLVDDSYTLVPLDPSGWRT